MTRQKAGPGLMRGYSGTGAASFLCLCFPVCRTQSGRCAQPSRRNEAQSSFQVATGMTRRQAGPGLTQGYSGTGAASFLCFLVLFSPPQIPRTFLQLVRITSVTTWLGDVASRPVSWMRLGGESVAARGRKMVMAVEMRRA